MTTEELISFGEEISYPLSQSQGWKNYVKWAVRHLKLTTKEEVSILAMGYDAGSRAAWL